MPKFSDKEIPLQLSPEWTERIESLAALDGRPFEEVANEVINEVLAAALPELIARKLRQQK